MQRLYICITYIHQDQFPLEAPSHSLPLSLSLSRYPPHTHTQTHTKFYSHILWQAYTLLRIKHTHTHTHTHWHTQLRLFGTPSHWLWRIYTVPWRERERWKMAITLSPSAATHSRRRSNSPTIPLVLVRIVKQTAFWSEKNFTFFLWQVLPTTNQRDVTEKNLTVLGFQIWFWRNC